MARWKKTAILVAALFPGFHKRSLLREAVLEKLSSLSREFAPFTFFKGDMRRDFLLAETLNHVGQTIGLRIEIGIVDLVGITRQYNLSALPSPRQNSFDLMRRQVLGFIDHKVLRRQRAAPYVRQRFYRQHALIDQFLITLIEALLP